MFNKFISYSNDFIHKLSRSQIRSFTKPKFVKIYEVGPRDGLQNEPIFIPSNVKIEFIDKLSQTGLQFIEATAFVNPKKIPQMSDPDIVFKNIKKHPNISYPVLIPNIKGLERAISVGVKEIAVFVAATEQFSQRNQNCSIEQGFARAEQVIKEAQRYNLKIRGYVSCVCGCPYEGRVLPLQVAKIAQRLYELGCYEISLGDTIGIGNVGSTEKMLEQVLKVIPKENISVHFHNTYGQALTNIYKSIEMGITTIDSSVAGIGGCPFAQGNVPTEDVIYMLSGMGIETGVQLDKLLATGEWMCRLLGRKPVSAVARALFSKIDKRLSEKEQADALKQLVDKLYKEYV